MSATKSTTLRLTMQQTDDVGEVPEKSLDVTALLSAWKAQVNSRIALPAAAEDQQFTVSSAPLAMVLVSHDNPFGVRLGPAPETLLPNLKFFVYWCADLSQGAPSTTIYLSGNGDNETDLEVWVIEKPT